MHRQGSKGGDRFRHVVLTRFSYRGAWVNSSNDPLEPNRLRRRFEVFETVTVPSLVNQSCQNFDYVVLVDPNLATAHLGRLHRLLESIPRAQVVAFTPDLHVEGLSWLADLGEPNADWLLTTNLDDDDALSHGFVASLQQWAQAKVRDATHPMHLVASPEVVEWTAIPSADHPSGDIGPRSRPLPASAGLTALASRAAADLSVLAIHHADVPRLSDETLAHLPWGRREHIERLRRISSHVAITSENFEYLHEGNSALMVNHLDNVQATRSIKPGSPLNGGPNQATLDRFGIDPEEAGALSRNQLMTIRRAADQVWRIYQLNVRNHSQPSMRRRLFEGQRATRRVVARLRRN